jgi:hypothetical protein
LGSPLELVLLAKNAPLEFEGDSRNSRTARKLREIVKIHAQTAVGFVKVGKAETAFFGVLKTLFILPVFTVPTFPSSQSYNIKQLIINSIKDLI